MGLARLKSAIASAGRDDSGAVLVEFAISLSVLVPIFVATIDLGLAMYRWLQVNDMAEAAALYTATNAQQLYSGPIPPGPFQKSLIQNAAASATTGLTGATTGVVGACTCAGTTPTTCPSSDQFANNNGTSAAPATYCSCATGDESAYVCITSNYNYTPILSVPYLPSSITLSARSVVKIH